MYDNQDSPQRVSLLGSTGSIGINTLDVIKRNQRRYRVHALSAYRQVNKLFTQCLEFEPDIAVIGNESDSTWLQEQLRNHGLETQVRAGQQALIEIASCPESDIVMAAIVGAAGLEPTLAAAQVGKKVLLANKESLVITGELFMAAVRAGGAQLLPVDSEHNAIFQALPTDYADKVSKNARCDSSDHGVRRLILTASGGPFRSIPTDQFVDITPEAACAHPNWSMGKKISVDSATMMNKGLEVIEACWLFKLPPDQVDVVLHPQSIVHSLVEYIDGSILAQMGNPDMRTPIAHALAYPERIEAGTPPLDLCRVAHLDFEKPDVKRFPCLQLAYDCLSIGGLAPAVLNAANEVAVDAFLARKLSFTRIVAVIDSCLEKAAGMFPSAAIATLPDILEADQESRRMAAAKVEQFALT